MAYAAMYLVLLGALVQEVRLSPGCYRTTPQTEAALSVKCESRRRNESVRIEYDTGSRNLTMTCEFSTYSCSTLTEARAVSGGAASPTPVEYLIVDNCLLDAPLMCALMAVNANDATFLVLKNTSGELSPELVLGLRSVTHIYMLDSHDEASIPYDLQTYLPGIFAFTVWGGYVQWMQNDQIHQGLTWLDFRNTPVKELPARSFSSTPNLRILLLLNNEIQIIDRDALQGLTTLDHLYISYNNITELAAGTFSHIVKLKWLSLSNNNIEHLPPELFSRQDALEGLYLEYNNISVLPPGLFKDLTNLTTLQLHFNKLRQLESRSFEGLHSLKELVLAYNRLTNLPPHVFASLHSLQRLWLQHNYIHIPEAVSPLGGLVELHYVNMSYNRLTHVCSDWRELPDLQLLDLSFNKITRLEMSRLFFGPPGLDLSH